MMGCSNPHPHCQVGKQPRKPMTSSSVSVNSTDQVQLVRANFHQQGAVCVLRKAAGTGASYTAQLSPLLVINVLINPERSNKNR